MIKRFPYCFLVLLMLCTAFPVLSQTTEEEIEEELFRLRIAELSFDFTKPLNTFGDRMNDNAYGLTGSYLWQTKPEASTFVGMELQWAPFYRVSTDFVDVIDGFSTNLRESTRTTLWSSHLITRFHPFDNFPAIDPFIEGLIGAKMMMTNTNITIIESAENIDFIVESTDVTFSYGFSAGFQMHLYAYQYYLFAKATFLRGTSNGFYAIPEEFSGQRNLTISDLEFFNAPIDVVRLQLGLSVSF